MKIKRLLLISQLVLLTSCAKAQKDKIDELNVQYVSLSIMTASRVDCDGFESYFNESVKNKKIISREFLDEFLSQLKNLSEIDDNYYPLPDTRIKVEVLLGDVSEVVCIGNLVVRYGEKSYINDKNFKQLLLNELK